MAKLKLFKRPLVIVCLFSVLCYGKAFAVGVEQYKIDTEEHWDLGSASEESTEDAIASSMIGWGIALTLIIAVAFACFHNSKS